MMNIHEFKEMVTMEMLTNLMETITVTFDRCFLKSFTILPNCEIIATYKDGKSYKYGTNANILMDLLTADSFGKTFNLIVKPLVK